MSLPSPFADADLLAVLDVLPSARIVGGAVRDMLARRPVQDIDIATPLSPEEVTRSLKRAGLRALPTGISHGTVTALSGQSAFEVTTLRRDVETDGRHAVVAFTEDWREDAARRDFTINAMSMERDGTLHDYFGGATDLAAGRLRFVGEPAARIAEDYLRVLRFFRFQGRYGRTPPDAETRAALAAAASRLGALSAERVWSETAKILGIADPLPVLQLMAELGVLAALFPEGTTPEAIGGLDADAPPDPLLRLAALLGTSTAATAVAARLKLSVAERDRLLALLTGPVPMPGEDDAALRRATAETEPAILVGRSLLRHPPAPESQVLRQRLAAMTPPIFPLQGRDAVALGLAQGPRVGQVMRQVRAWWLARGCMDGAEACRAELARVVAASAS
jgi:poly(A) polymerase